MVPTHPVCRGSQAERIKIIYKSLKHDNRTHKSRNSLLPPPHRNLQQQTVINIHIVIHCHEV